MKTETTRTQSFRSFPRTVLEQRVFTACEVNERGMRLFLKLDEDGALTLPTTAAVAVLEDLVSSARRRLLELELAAMPMGGGHGGSPAADAVGTAGEAGPRPRAPD